MELNKTNKNGNYEGSSLYCQKSHNNRKYPSQILIFNPAGEEAKINYTFFILACELENPNYDHWGPTNSEKIIIVSLIKISVSNQNSDN